MPQKAHRPHIQLIICFSIIIIFGLLMITSASQVISLDKFAEPYYYLKHQLLYSILPGIALFILCSNINYRFWKKIALPLFIFSLILLILVFIPQLSYGHGGAKRWLYFSFFTIQPSELAKLSLIIFLASWFDQKKDEIKNSHYTFLPFILYLGLITSLIALEPDIGTLSVIISIALAIYWVAGAKIIHIGSIILIGVLMFIMLIQLAPYRLARITSYLNPDADVQGISYQINQSLLAVGSGGLFGLSWGQSKQKYQYLPEVVGDSIFAVIAEELGFIITTVFILLYLYLILLTFQVAERSSDNFAKFTATGIATWFGYQGFANMSAMLKIIPLTGLPLPFISYGSSAMIVSIATAGILINISKYTKSRNT